MSLRMMRLRTLSTLLAAGLMVGAACTTFQPQGPTKDCTADGDASAGTQGILSITAGDGDTITPGTPLTLGVRLVKVIADSGDALCDRVVQWFAASGSLSQTQVLTDSTRFVLPFRPGGDATTVWTAPGSPGTYTISATVLNSIPTLSAIFTVTVQGAVGDPYLTIVSVDPQTAPAGTVLPPLVVKFADANGTPGPATDLTWQVAGGGTVAQPTTTSDANTGLSQNSWTLGTVGAQSVTVSEPGGSSVVFTATATPPGAHPKAEIRVYNVPTNPAVTVSLQTPFDGLKTLLIAPGASVGDSLQVEVGVRFMISSTVGAQTATVTCTTIAAIIPVPGDPFTGNALVAVSFVAGTLTLSCSGGWQ